MLERIDDDGDDELVVDNHSTEFHDNMLMNNNESQATHLDNHSVNSNAKLLDTEDMEQNGRDHDETVSNIDA